MQVRLIRRNRNITVMDCQFLKANCRESTNSEVRSTKYELDDCPPLVLRTSNFVLFTYLCAHDTGKITGYAVPHCRDKEVSLTSLTDNKR